MEASFLMCLIIFAALFLLQKCIHVGILTLEQSKTLLRAGLKASQRFALCSQNNSKFTFRKRIPCTGDEMGRFEREGQDRVGGEASAQICCRKEAREWARVRN